ncbi:MAG TPA: glutamate formiminotransferase, partial [Actinomycetota bacterium]|nr:glutamate formiminotransferase [Actinomycetota bacterium]
MNQQPILGCALNLSEGRRAGVVNAVARAASSAAAVLDTSSDPDHNRTVLTLCAAPSDLIEGVVCASRAALEHIDLRSHNGVHPRLGAVDVVPFYPLRNASMTDAVSAAKLCAERLWEELNLPCFLYEEAATTPESRALPWIRRNAFAGTVPDVGGPGAHPTGGAAVVGARGLLVAYNVDLDSTDLPVARRIASAIRGAVPGRVRSLGFALPRREGTQVSMNIIRPELVCLEEVFAAVVNLAK